MQLAKIVSGGQTGVDRAGLDAAIEAGVPCGGWCPRGRAAEDGPIPAVYPLDETHSQSYALRTRWNVRDSDGTLIVSGLPLSGGTALTQQVAERMGRPCLVCDIDDLPAIQDVSEWVRSNDIQVINIAGPRARTRPDAYESTRQFLRQLIEFLRGEG